MDRNGTNQAPTYFLNPASMKIKNSFSKKSSNKGQQLSVSFTHYPPGSPSHTRHLTLGDKDRGYNPEELMAPLKQS